MDEVNSDEAKALYCMIEDTISKENKLMEKAECGTDIRTIADLNAIGVLLRAARDVVNTVIDRLSELEE